MKKTTKLFALLLAAASVITAAGCKKDVATENTRLTEDGKAILDYFLPMDPGSEYTSDTWAIKHWGEQTGTQINIQPIQRDVFTEKIAAVFAAGNLPDLINFYQDDKTVNTYADKLFVPLTDYLESGKLPNLQKMLDKYPDVLETNTRLEDGKLYGFPAIREYDAPFGSYEIREDLLNKAGWTAEDIKTIDDLKAALLALQEVNDQPYVTSCRLGWNYFAEYSAFIFGTSPKMMFDNRTSDGTNKWIYGPTGKMYKEWVEFFRWMYENEIIHPSFATMTQQELQAGYADGKFQMAMEQTTMVGGTLGTYNDEKPDRKLGVISFLDINGETPKQPMLPHSHNGYRWPVTVSNTSPNVAAAMSAMDWLYSEEGILEMNNGLEGEHYLVDENYSQGRCSLLNGSYYNKTRLKNGEITKEEYDAIPRANQDLGMSAWISPWRGLEGDHHKDDKTALAKDKRRSDEIQKMIDAGVTLDPDPVVKLTPAEQEEVNDLTITLETYVSEQTLKFIYGQLDMSEWDNFQAQMKEMGADRLCEIYNK